MKTIQTERLTIRNFTVDDWQALQDMVVQYQNSQYAIYDHKWPTSTVEIKGITKWFASGDSYFAVWLKETQTLIGFISLNKTKQKKVLEFDLGYLFNFDYHGKKYAREGCKALLDYAFGPLAAHRVTSGTAAANLPSCQLLESLGMNKTGEGMGSLQKTEQGKPIEFLGLSFAITREEWFAQD